MANFAAQAPTAGVFPLGGDALGTNYTLVSGNYPKVQFSGAGYASESDLSVWYPIPIPALTEAGWCADDADHTLSDYPVAERHFSIVDVDNQYLYEMYYPYYNATQSPVQWMEGEDYVQPGQYWCQSCCFWDMKTNNYRTEGWTSSDAAGLQYLPGVLRYDEITGAGPIQHALRIVTYQGHLTPPNHYWPATHSAGAANNNYPPLGSRLRLKANYDISWASAPVQKVLQCMKTYGLIVADYGVIWYYGGWTMDLCLTRDVRWGAWDDPDGIVYKLKGWDRPGEEAIAEKDDFELIELGWGDPR